MAEKQHIVVDIDKILAAKAGSKAKYVPRFVVNWLKKLVHQDEVNEFLLAHEDEEGVEWLKSAVEYTDMNMTITGKENLPEADGKRYTFVSNHPLGGIDGVTIGAIIGEKYGNNIRYLLNDILMNLPGLRPLGIPVNNFGGQARDLPRKVEELFQSDYQVVMFPAQLCSRLINGKVQDLPWKKTFIQKSIKTQRDIVPIRFDAQNSKKFYRIANFSKAIGLKFNLAQLFLVDELYKNRHHDMDVHIGKPIPWQTFDKSRTADEWAQWVRQKVYEL